MLGPAKPRRLDEPIAVSLEELVPTDHFYQHLEAKLDLSFVRTWVQDLYAERGRPSIDVRLGARFFAVCRGKRIRRRIRSPLNQLDIEIDLRSIYRI